MRTEEIIRKYEKYIMPTYTRKNLVFSRAEGLKVWTPEGVEYLDFFPGWAVSGLGHCHKRVVRAIREQAGKIIHISNNYYNKLQADLAEKLIQHSFNGKVFFANSGAEANECAIKLARKYGGGGSRYEIITAEKSFHGRTMATISATGQEKVKAGFHPLLEGFRTVPFNNLKAVEKAITEKTVAIMIEPIQGEGGINVASGDYLRGLKQLCDERDLLLMFDEVQTGMGRTGEIFCYKHFGVEPHIMTLAKSLGGGVPIGCAIAAEGVADTLTAGNHASTFGGSPLVCAAALAVLEAIEEERLIENARSMGAYLRKGLERLKDEFSFVKQVKGMGLMLGLELSKECKGIYEQAFKRRLLINCTQGNILRIMPPITVTKPEIDKALGILSEAIRQGV